MSGGHWNYDQCNLKSFLDEVIADPEVKKLWPNTHEKLERYGERIYKVLHAMDWHLSGDTEQLTDTALFRVLLGIDKEVMQND